VQLTRRDPRIVMIGAIEAMDRRRASTIEVRRQVYEQFNAEVDSRMKGTVCNSGCASFYLDDTGRNGVLWPDWTWRFRRLAARFDETAYELQASARVAVAA
jgi:hypothetical protein